MKFIVHCYPTSCYFLFRLKYSPQHPILKCPQPIFFPYVKDQISHFSLTIPLPYM